jgi:gelsolin
MEKGKYVLKIEESNLAFLGSEMEKKLKLQSASTEEVWKGAGEKVGMKIWRIEKFQIKTWPVDKYGSFFMGDSYIILYTFTNDGTTLLHNAHIWLGSESSQDEAATAAYKVVELDTYLKGFPVLFREVQGSESPIFLSYFPLLKILSGGIESGFKKNEPSKYKPKLLHIRKIKNNVRIMETPLSCNSLNSGDCFILDAGLKIFSWNGKDSNSFEKFKTTELAKNLEEKRNGAPEVFHFSEGEESSEFWEILGGKNEIKPANIVTDENLTNLGEKIMFKLSDSSGEMILTKVEFCMEDLDSSEVYIIDLISHLIIWLGSKSSQNEKKNSLSFALQYIKDFNRPSTLQICSVQEGRSLKDLI